ncbi:MAG TPA: phosphogluconate dehydrogenase (NADP(+)-dependent, decarboxylating) [Erysipelotrichaceae bacterium]|nr:phosphogluconate dehydrogenase (NADP(+)-dependent, decarboxylating) [Erysipelotrichaceae bacterium]
MKKNIGVIGMAVMGKNLALNIADHGYSVAIYNRTYEVTKNVLLENPNANLIGSETLEEFVNLLESPRKIILMVKAGKPVDAFLDLLYPLLDEGDIVADAGNSFFLDTIRREKAAKEKGINFFGMGVSGGEEGARFGPAIMPGGNKEAHAYLKDMLEAISAKAEGEACTTYIGSDGAGHYVKMVHNGIEYGDMELISEAYHLLKNVGGLNNKELADVFTEWNKGDLDSYLIEITSHIFKTKDDLSDADIIDVIKDNAGQKGTGIWTSKESMDLGIHTSVITSAVYARFISSLRDERIRAHAILPSHTQTTNINRNEFIEKVRKALYLAKVVSYAQGFALLKEAAQQYKWDLDFEAIAKIFRGGCIIRARFLNRIAEAYTKNPKLDNLLLDDYFLKIADDSLFALREVNAIAILNGVPAPAFSSAINYYDAYRSDSLSTNLVQAQRDYFGAHTYERLDREGSYHYETWGKDVK